MSQLQCYRDNCQKVWTIVSPVKYEHCPSCGCSNVTTNAIERASEGAAMPGQDVVTHDPIKPSAPASDPAQAFKSDAGKVQMDLLEDGCPQALLYIAKVMTWAVEVKGYHPHSWREVPQAIKRYRAALGRHRNAIALGEVYDPESGLPHWAHAACCVIFLLELENFDVK